MGTREIDKRWCTGQEIVQLGSKDLEKETGQTAHEIKADALGTNKNLSEFDLYKTSKGDIVVKPKAGSGTGEPTGLRINQRVNQPKRIIKPDEER